MTKILTSVFTDVAPEELQELRVVLDKKGNKKAFLDSLPRTRAIHKSKKAKPLYTRRQLDYGLERGIMQQGLLNHLRAFKQRVSPQPVPI